MQTWLSSHIISDPRFPPGPPLPFPPPFSLPSFPPIFLVSAQFLLRLSPPCAHLTPASFLGLLPPDLVLLLECSSSRCHLPSVFLCFFASSPQSYLVFLAVFTTAIFLFTFSSPFRLVLQIPACTVAPGLLSARDLTAGRGCFPSSLRALYTASLSVSHGLCHRISGKLPTCTWKVFPLPPQSPRLVTVGSHAHLETPETQTPFVCRPQPASPTPSLALSAQCPLLPGALLSLLCGPSDPAGGGAEAGPGPPADERVFICTRVCAMFGGEAGGKEGRAFPLCRRESKITDKQCHNWLLRHTLRLASLLTRFL